MTLFTYKELNLGSFFRSKGGLKSAYRVSHRGCHRGVTGVSQGCHRGSWGRFWKVLRGGVLEIGPGAAFKGGGWSGGTQGRQIWGQILIENRSIFDVF